MPGKTNKEAYKEILVNLNKIKNELVEVVNVAMGEESDSEKFKKAAIKFHYIQASYQSINVNDINVLNYLKSKHDKHPDRTRDYKSLIDKINDLIDSNRERFGKAQEGATRRKSESGQPLPHVAPHPPAGPHVVPHVAVINPPDESHVAVLHPPERRGSAPSVKPHPPTEPHTTLPHPPAGPHTTLPHPPAEPHTTVSHPPTEPHTTLPHPPTEPHTTLPHPPTEPEHPKTVPHPPVQPRPPVGPHPSKPTAPIEVPKPAPTVDPELKKKRELQLGNFTTLLQKLRDINLKMMHQEQYVINVMECLVRIEVIKNCLRIFYLQ